MKHSKLLFLFVAASLLLSGCHDAYYQKIEELESRAAQLQLLCDQINTNIVSLQALVKALENTDMISGTTSITENGVVVGYKINFVNSNPITIINGITGLSPLIGSKMDSDGRYYWTIQYGDSNVNWIYDDNGNKVLAMGITPYTRIRNDIWQISVDDGNTWTDIGRANGENGDTMFRSFDTSNPDYVTITLSNGTVLKIPTFYAFEQVNEDIVTTNDNVNALKSVIEAIADSCSYIKTVSPVTSEGKTIGTYIELSNGKNFTIHNYIGSNVPLIGAFEDTTDHRMYWAIQYGSEERTWILNSNGQKISAIGTMADDPLIGIKQDSDGYYYWTVTVGGQTSYLYAPDRSRPHALDSVANSVFLNVDNSNSDYLKLLTKDSTQYLLPKMYSVLVTTSVTMRANTSSLFAYRVYGDEQNATTLTFITQGGVSVKKESGRYFTITTPTAFNPTIPAKIVVIFNINNSTKTVVKTINITEG